jgi:DNA-binding SARP family transcriptional activator
MMQARLLGPLDARMHGRSVVPAARKPKQVLAVLLLNVNRIVSTSALMKELWGEDRPKSATAALQTYVLQVRKLIQRALAAGGEPPQKAKKVLTTKENSYGLMTASARVDLQDFSRLVGEGRAEFAAENWAAASKQLNSALSLWQGEPLMDVTAGPLLKVEIRRLEEARLTALELRIEMDMRMGRHHAVLSELTALSETHKLNEHLHAQFMLALHRAGRRSQALEVFHRLRRSYVEELGLEPSPELYRLHQCILSADPSLEYVPPGLSGT